MSIANGFHAESDLLCVGYKEHFEIIEEQTGDIKKVHRLEAFGQVTKERYVFITLSAHTYIRINRMLIVYLHH